MSEFGKYENKTVNAYEYNMRLYAVYAYWNFLHIISSRFACDSYFAISTHMDGKIIHLKCKIHTGSSREFNNVICHNMLTRPVCWHYSWRRKDLLCVRKKKKTIEKYYQNKSMTATTPSRPPPLTGFGRCVPISSNLTLYLNLSLRFVSVRFVVMLWKFCSCLTILLGKTK